MFTSSLRIGATAPMGQFNLDARAERFFHEHRKLMNAAKNFVYAHPALVMLGEDPLVDHLIASSGFGPTDLACLRIAGSGRMVTVICVPTRHWRNPEVKARLLEIKREARENRTSCILVPQRWLKADLRSSIARTIARARNVRYSRKHMELVIHHLRAARISTIAEAAGALTEHDDPIGVVLAMAAQGMVHLDRSSALRADSWISTRL
jgi:hypothetical protein